jgi:hypothetical protein
MWNTFGCGINVVYMRVWGTSGIHVGVGLMWYTCGCGINVVDM